MKTYLQIKINEQGNSLLKTNVLLICIILLPACIPEGGNNKTSKGTPQNSIETYNLQEPDDIFQLTGSLEEISGISLINEHEIACIQDEEGILFIYDIIKRKITSEIKFGKAGDYEDVSIIHDNAYVLRSDGTIIEIQHYRKQSREISSTETPLSHRNNTEGLCYDSARNYLLIACKGNPFINNHDNNNAIKAVYAYNLKKRKLIEKPIYQLHLKELHPPEEKKGKITAFFEKLARKSKLASNYLWFNPSGIAINPINPNNIFLISNKGKYMLMLDKTSGTMHLEKLNNRLFSQPEGISFNRNGDLFISNEATGGGNILRFNVKK